MTIRSKILPIALTLAILLTGCKGAGEPEEEPQEYIAVTLRLFVPSDFTSRSYDDPLDYDTKLQKYISPDDIYLVVCDEEGNIVLVPDMGEVEGTQGDEFRTVRAYVPYDENAFTFRVIANVVQGSTLAATPEAVRNALLSFGTDKNLCDGIKANRFSNGKWNLTKYENYLPMHSAMSWQMPFDHNITLTVPMYRSLAKIGVEYVGEDTRYELKRVRVCRQHEYGAFVSPKVPSGDANQQYQSPYILADTPTNAYETEYTATSTNEVLETIFVPEHHNDGGSGDIYLQAGFSKDDSADLIWYDMYFTQTGHSDSPVYDVVRNHSYIFRISWIKDRDLEVIVDAKWDEEHTLGAI